MKRTTTGICRFDKEESMTLVLLSLAFGFVCGYVFQQEDIPPVTFGVICLWAVALIKLL